MLLITTTRKTCKNTLKFAKFLSNCFPLSIFEPRGKKGVFDLVDRARLKGCTRIAIISTKKGNPYLVRIIKVQLDNWNYLAELIVHGYKYIETIKKFENIQFIGPMKENFLKIFDQESFEEGPKFDATDTEIKIIDGKKEVLKLKYSLRWFDERQ
ncbi:MAG: hypothetical protein QXL75_02195 [archaeon]